MACQRPKFLFLDALKPVVATLPASEKFSSPCQANAVFDALWPRLKECAVGHKASVILRSKKFFCVQTARRRRLRFGNALRRWPQSLF